MNTLRMALTELRRVTGGRLPRLAMLALTAVPLLYGGLYLYANHDPYGRLHEVPAAVVVEDRGATMSDGRTLAAGEQVAHDLLASHSFDWHRTTATRASAGVRDGRYDFSLTLPADFSAALASTGRYTPRQGVLVLTTNDANNAVVHTIADQVADRVRDSLARQVGARAADEFLVGFATVRGQLVEAADGADRIATGATQARDGAGQLTTGADQLASGADQLAGGLSTLRQSTAGLPAQTTALATGARQVADGNTQIATLGSQVAGGAQRIVDQLDGYRTDLERQLRADGLTDAQIQAVLASVDRLRQPVQDANRTIQTTSGQLSQLADGSRQVADGSAKLAGATPALVNGIGQAADGATQLKGGTHTLAAGGRTLGTGLGDLAGGAGTLRDRLRAGSGEVPQLSDGNRSATANTIADPVKVRNVAHSRARSYGAGLAPFFVSLAAWIGGYVLFLFLRPLSPRAMAANQPPLRVAVAGWLTPAVLGTAQMFALFLVLLLWLRLDPAHPLGTVAFMVLTSGAFVAIVHALNAWLGVVGEFLGLVLMVAQLVSAGGTFPWQTLPGPLRVLHDVLPMGYAVDALRQLLYGGDLGAVGRDATVVATYLVAALAASTLAARRLRVWSPTRIKPELVL